MVLHRTSLLSVPQFYFCWCDKTCWQKAGEGFMWLPVPDYSSPFGESWGRSSNSQSCDVHSQEKRGPSGSKTTPTDKSTGQPTLDHPSVSLFPGESMLRHVDSSNLTFTPSIPPLRPLATHSRFQTCSPFLCDVDNLLGLPLWILLFFPITWNFGYTSSHALHVKILFVFVYLTLITFETGSPNAAQASLKLKIFLS